MRLPSARAVHQPVLQGDPTHRLGEHGSEDESDAADDNTRPERGHGDAINGFSVRISALASAIVSRRMSVRL